MWKTQDIKKEVSLEELEMSLNVEEDVGLARIHSLEVGLLHTAVVKVEPGLVVRRKGSIMA